MVVSALRVLLLANAAKTIFGSLEGKAALSPQGNDSVGGGCLNGPCWPGNDFCGEPFKDAPVFHLMDQHGCSENDPNSPVFDPVHGVFHHFYQIHLAASPGFGPDAGHFVSKDFINWAQVPVAIWNGLDASTSPPRVTKYDNMAIFTGSAFVVDGAGPGGKGPGVVQIYPGLCNKNDWPACSTGTLLAQAVPANYANDELLVNWTKPPYNPIMENAQRDPASAWKTPHGEWRTRTLDSKIYGAASDADVLSGKWYEIGTCKDLRRCECPSLYPLPSPTPGFEEEYHIAAQAGGLPTHVHKTSCGGDFWQLGTYEDGPPKVIPSFKATPGWEDLFEQKIMDVGKFYASKDGEYPSKTGGKRRINWGWAIVPPASTQSLPREVTFNAAARCLQQSPIDELMALRGPAVYSKADVRVLAGVSTPLGIAPGLVKQSEAVVSFTLPSEAAQFGLAFSNENTLLACVVSYSPPTPNSSVRMYEVPVTCGGFKDSLRLLAAEKKIEIRVFSDWTFMEVYFQKGRVAMTVPQPFKDSTDIVLTSTVHAQASAVDVYPIRSIWTSPEVVRKAPRSYELPDSVIQI